MASRTLERHTTSHWFRLGLSRNLFGVLVLLTLLLVPLPRTSSYGLAQGLDVDTSLVIAVDCSYSVDAREFDLQRRGIADAFRDPSILAAIQRGGNGSVAVTVLQWSSSQSQVVAVPWTIVNNEISAQIFAEAVATMPRLTAEGGTSISSAIDASVQLLTTAPHRSGRFIIDIQADGTNNNGGDVDAARDRALAYGIVINGLTIINEISWLHFYFRNHVIGGPGAFVEIANNYDSYARAIRQKILRELGPPLFSDRRDPTRSAVLQ
ncbi:MAG: DUF1194 domain-containing protein [Pseudomonadota bacterium]